MPARDTVSDRIPEWRLQAAIASSLDARIALEHPLAYAASLEGVLGNLNAYQNQLAKACGSKAGEPDLRLYFAKGRIVFVELKETTTGKLTKSQKDRIPILRGLGFVVHVVFAASEDEAKEAVRAIVDAELAGDDSGAFPSATWWPKVRR